jgi:hypothetical protein
MMVQKCLVFSSTVLISDWCARDEVGCSVFLFSVLLANDMI